MEIKCNNGSFLVNRSKNVNRCYFYCYDYYYLRVF